MKKIKKQLQIILYVWVWLLSFSMADAAEAITDEYWITTADRGKIEQRYRSLGIYEVAKKTVSRKEEQYGNYTYRVWYPKRLETENRKWPMVFLLNGTTSTCDLDEPIFEHLASWGFIVVGNTDRNTGLGYSAEWGLELMDKLAADRKSVFFQKIDEENLGIGGHSQGGVGAVKTILFRKGGRRFKTVVTVSAVTESFADKLKMNSWKYDASAVNVPWFMVSGDRLDDRLIISCISNIIFILLFFLRLILIGLPVQLFQIPECLCIITVHCQYFLNLVAGTRIIFHFHIEKSQKKMCVQKFAIDRQHLFQLNNGQIITSLLAIYQRLIVFSQTGIYCIQPRRIILNGLYIFICNILAALETAADDPLGQGFHSYHQHDL